MMMRLALFLVALVAAPAIHVDPARAEWPDRPIKMIVPFSAGSSSDTIARIVGLKLGEALGTPTMEKDGVHRGHLPSLVMTVTPAQMPFGSTTGRIESNGRKAREVTGRQPPLTVGTRPAGGGRARARHGIAVP